MHNMKSAIFKGTVEWLFRVFTVQPPSPGNIASPPGRNPSPVSGHPHPHSPRQPPVCFLSLWACLIWTFRIDGLRHHVEAAVLLPFARWCFRSPPHTQPVSAPSFLSRLSGSPLCGRPLFYLSVFSSMRPGVASSFVAVMNTCASVGLRLTGVCARVGQPPPVVTLF